jgi:hypothetical protein
VKNEVTAMQRPEHWFRMSFWWLFLIVCGWAIPITVAIIVVLELLGTMTISPAMLAGMVAGIVAGELTGLLFLLPVVFYYTTGVGPEGVRGFNFWGVYRDAPWGDFRSVRPITFFGLRFLRAHTNQGGSPLWLPVFLVGAERFRLLVLEYAGPAHPLSQALVEEVL